MITRLVPVVYVKELQEHKMGDGGKGSSPRPYSVSQGQFADNWEKIFGKKKKSTTTEDNQKKDDDERTLDREVPTEDS